MNYPTPIKLSGSSMKSSMKLLSILVIILAVLGTLTLHILISINKNTLNDLETQIKTEQTEITKIQSNAPFTQYQRNTAFITKNPTTPYSKYIRELLFLVQTPFTIKNIQLQEGNPQGVTKNTEMRVSVTSTPELPSIAGLISKIKENAVYYTMPFAPSVSIARDANDAAVYSFPITLQLTRFENANTTK